MFEEILPREAVRVIESISHHLETFYLAGGTGLAIQLGHRKSYDFDFFKRRFKDSGINFYHIVKSLVFFEDANQEPDPIMIMTGDDWKWESIKSFFFNHINQFEKELGVRA